MGIGISITFGTLYSDPKPIWLLCLTYCWCSSFPFWLMTDLGSIRSERSISFNVQWMETKQNKSPCTTLSHSHDLDDNSRHLGQCWRWFLLFGTFACYSTSTFTFDIVIGTSLFIVLIDSDVMVFVWNIKVISGVEWLATNFSAQIQP